MSSFGARVMTGGVLAVIGLVTIKVLVAVVSGFMALLGFLFFTVLPIAVVGWFVLKIVRSMKSSDKPAFE
ncbi:hypothetical protein BH23GEM9_BH23GEM9_06980 [soil metagenome]